MRQVLSRSLMTAAATSGVLAGAAGYAQADAGAQSGAANSPGVLSGNTVQAPVHIPANVCGNSVSVVGLLNPTFGNQCANDGSPARPAERPAPEKPAPEAPEHDHHERTPEKPAEQAPPADSSERVVHEEQPVERASVPAQRAPAQPAAEQEAPRAAQEARPADPQLAATGAAGAAAMAALGAGVLAGGLVLYRRSTRRNG
ncbi:chaplin [Streptomyces cacaoi]|uniref:chaplin n=1 Tax=Streptomyces cacaoi TaxID=1898 RepID=UPI002607EB68|nr:chaplin family protein [Streptomyces cacaoi]